MRGRKAAFLDRDGTINVDYGYVGDPDRVTLLPDVVGGLRLLADSGFELVVVTNQSGVHRGYFPMNSVHSVNQRLQSMLATEGLTIAGFYICPHGPDEGCRCRKPLPGLAEQASRDLGLDPKRSIMIGDKESDIELGRAIGAFTARLAPEATSTCADLVAPDWRALTPGLAKWCALPAICRDRPGTWTP